MHVTAVPACCCWLLLLLLLAPKKFLKLSKSSKKMQKNKKSQGEDGRFLAQNAKFFQVLMKPYKGLIKIRPL